MRKLLVGLAVLLLAGPAAMAAVTMSASAPTENVEISSWDYDPHSGPWLFGGEGEEGLNKLGQYFTSPSGIVAAVTARLNQLPTTLTAGDVVYCRLYTAGDFSDWGTYVEQASTSGTGFVCPGWDEPPVPPGNMGEYITATFDSAVTMAAGTQYAFLFSILGDEVDGDEWDGDRLPFRDSSGNEEYAGGDRVTVGEDGLVLGWGEEGPADLEFSVQVPEPATLALLGLGGLGLLLRRKRR